MRLFVAIDIPLEIKEKIDLFLFDFEKEIKSPVKWVERDNLHINLKFIGEVLDKKTTEITEAINRALQDYNNHQPLVVNIENVLVFPNLYQPRVIGLKILTDKNLAELANKIKSEIEKLPDIEKETRQFKPHLTLGRVKGSLTNSERELIKNIKFTDSFTAGEIILYQSFLSAGGPEYKKVNKFEL